MNRLAGFVSAAGLVFTIACAQTDAGITTNVKTKLAADDMVKAYQVDVDTQNRIVTLTGAVETPMAKMQAVRIARETDGVRDVIDQLTVDATAATSGRIDIDRDDVDVDVDVDNDLGADIKQGAGAVGDATKRGAEAVGDAAKKGAVAVKDGAKKVGSEIKDAVTDDDPDTDKDGR